MRTNLQHQTHFQELQPCNLERRPSIKLTSREMEVLNELAKGYTDNEIGSVLFISHHTVSEHRKNLMLKFEAKNSCHLIYKACTLGVI